MDYREQAKELLSRKNSLISAYTSIKQELQQLEEQKYVCKTAAANAREGVDGAVYEDRIINILADMEDCRFRKSIIERELSKIEKGMEGLTEYQKDIINSFFVDPVSGAAEDIMLRWYRERSTVYRDRNRALEQFTRSIYGVLQL